MPTYVYSCPKCSKTKEQNKHVDLRHVTPTCGWCGQKMTLKIGGMTLLGREKPGLGSTRIERGLKEADGDASVYHTLRNDESIGGDHWKKVKSEHDPGMLKEARDWGKANGV